MIEKKGWINFKAYNGNYYWSYGNGDGTIKTEQWIKDNGKWYYVDYYGDLIIDGSFEIGNKAYLFDSNGAMIEKKVGFIQKMNLVTVLGTGEMEMEQ